MMLQISYLYALLLLFCVDQIICGILNIQDDHDFNLERSKRQLPLVFPRGAICKLVLGIVVPIQTTQKIPVVFGANFQYQYPHIQNITETAAFYPYTTISSRSKKAIDDLKERENERYLFYKGTEEILNMHRLDGKACMLRAICESAQIPLYEEGFVGEILHILLTPNYGSDSTTSTIYTPPRFEEYAASQRAGELMFDCASIYGSCTRDRSLLDLISQLYNI